ncbi:MAG TPA: GerMN domain-containing protein [Vicinamibacterales bacterium]|nr:GerMN domain-containing protein [Vicinamibacterales bacterium]
MTRGRLLTGTAILVGAVAVWWILFIAAPGLYRPRPQAETAQPQQTDGSAAQRKITATLFFIGQDGMSLETVQREVPFGDPVDEQARRIIEAQIAPPPDSLASAVPAGVKLRALYVSERGEAFVDFSGEITTQHTGGALDELFTVYAVVNALTVNLPAITRVQILIDGKEADTLAGHVDLRRPLSKNLQWIKTDNPS